MIGVLYFFALAQQTFFILAGFWPITLIFVAGWIWAFGETEVDASCNRWKLFFCGCMPPFAIPILILVCGVVFVHDGTRGGVSPTDAEYLIFGLFVAQLSLAVLLVWLWWQRWPAVLASSLLAAYTSLAAGFISAMSVTGNWL